MIGEAAIDGADFAIEGEREENVVEGVDEVAVALLRAFDYCEKFVEFAVVRWLLCCAARVLLRDRELGHFLRTLPGVHAKQRDENDQTDRKGFKTNS